MRRFFMVIVFNRQGLLRSPDFILWGMPIMAILALAARIPIHPAPPRPNADGTKPSQGVPRSWD